MPIVTFLKDLMRRRKNLPSQLAAELGISHTTVIRWLSGKDIPNTRSCQKLASYSGVSPVEILSFAGHMPIMVKEESAKWPEFREYAIKKYPDELDEDMIAMIEDLIERRRKKVYGRKNRKVGI